MSLEFCRTQLHAALYRVAACVFVALAPTAALAQIDPGGGGGGGTSPFSGVAVDADGVLARKEMFDATGQLMRTRLEQAEAKLDADVARGSELRKVSLTRLIAAAGKAIADGDGIDDTMRRLAGLTRIQYVFYFPETKDIVLAGPAEGWVETPDGRTVGWNTGQPVLELQDLVVAMRTFPPGKRGNPLVHCSIDPTAEGLHRMQQFLSQVGRQIGPGDEQFIVEGLRESLGLQVITIGGVPASTHFAQVMVEADYRMKLIGIGVEDAPVRIPSFAAMAKPSAVSRNALQRWYFVPDYDRVKVTEDGLAAEFVGAGVKLVGEDEVVSEHGGRQATSRQSSASRKFTQAFTARYNDLALRSPVYAQLRNCIDMLVACAFIQKHDLFDQAGLDLGPLGDEKAFPVEVYNAPKQVESVVNSMWKGNTLMTPIGGGVEIRAANALADGHMQPDEDGLVARVRDTIDISQLPADRWWWD